MTATGDNRSGGMYNALVRWWGNWRAARSAADQLAEDFVAATRQKRTYPDRPSEPASAAGQQQAVKD